MNIPQNVRDAMPLAAQMISIPTGKRILARYPRAEVTVAPIAGGKLAVRMIWHRNEAFDDQGDGDGTGSIREVEEVVHDGWSDALFSDLSEALRWAKSMNPSAWRRQRNSLKGE